MRIRWKAALPAAGVVMGVLGSPQVLALLPDKWAQGVLAVSAIAAIFTPAAVTNRPPSDPNTTGQ